jgi:excisionase family DNA binding protein
MSATTTSTPTLLTIPEFARRLWLHRETGYRKIGRGEIPAVRLGGEPNAALGVP